MMITYTPTEGSQTERPLEVDTASSKRLVYLRKNIRQVERTDEVTKEAVTLWAYDEARLTNDEYTRYLGEDNLAKIEYVAMMSDIEL